MRHPILFVIAVIWSISIVSLLLIAAWEWVQHKRKLQSRLQEATTKGPLTVRRQPVRVTREVSEDLGTAA